MLYGGRKCYTIINIHYTNIRTQFVVKQFFQRENGRNKKKNQLHQHNVMPSMESLRNNLL